jgi:hypothetical protein
MECATPPILHIWGLPIWPFWHHASGSTATDFGIEQLAQSLLWRHQRPARRRLGFASWSWAGWEGRVTFPQHQSLLSFWSEVILEDHNGKTHRIDSWFSRPKSEAIRSVASYPHAIWLDGVVISPKALRFDAPSETATRQNQHLKEAWQRPAMEIDEYRIHFKFVGFGKQLIYQGKLLVEEDVFVPDVHIYLSDFF